MVAFVFTRDGKIIRNVTLKNIFDAIDVFGEGKYSVMRTLSCTRIIALAAHSDRIDMDKALLKKVLSRLYHEQKWISEQRITVASFRDSNVIINEPFYPKDFKKPLAIKLRHGERENVSIKTTSWLFERQKYSLNGDFEEIVLIDQETGEYREGLSSNFFCIYNGSVYSAKLALKGTIGEIVKRCLSEENIPFHFNRSIQDPIEAAFLTSTSRLLLPIDEIEFPDGHRIIINSHINRLVERISKCVESKVRNESESFLN